MPGVAPARPAGEAAGATAKGLPHADAAAGLQGLAHPHLQHACKHLLRDPETLKPPVLWGQQAAEALGVALDAFDDGNFAAVLAAIREQATPEFVVHALARPPADSPRWQACLDLIMPYVESHTRQIEHTPSFVASPLHGPCVRGVVDALEVWMERLEPQAEVGAPWDYDFAPPWLTRSAAWVKEESDALRFFIAYTSDAQFVSPHLIRLLAVISNEDTCSSLACKLLPVLMQRNRAWIESRQDRPWVAFAQEHGFGPTLDVFADKQKLSVPGYLCMRLFVAVTDFYGARFVAPLVGSFPCNLQQKFLTFVAGLGDSEVRESAEEIARLLNISIGQALGEQDLTALEGGDAGDEEDVPWITSANSCDFDPGALDLAGLGDARLYDLSEFSDYRGSVHRQSYLHTSSSSESIYESARSSESDEEEQLDSVEGEVNFARELWDITETLARANHVDALVRVVVRAGEIENPALRHELWFCMVRRVMQGQCPDAQAPRVLAALPEKERAAVMSRKDYDIVMYCVLNCLLTGATPAKFLRPEEVHGFLLTRESEAVQKIWSASELPWRVVELMAEALDDAGKLTLLGMVRDLVARYQA